MAQQRSIERAGSFDYDPKQRQMYRDLKGILQSTRKLLSAVSSRSLLPVNPEASQERPETKAAIDPDTLFMRYLATLKDAATKNGMALISVDTFLPDTLKGASFESFSYTVPSEGGIDAGDSHSDDGPGDGKTAFTEIEKTITVNSFEDLRSFAMHVETQLEAIAKITNGIYAKLHRFTPQYSKKQKEQYDQFFSSLVDQADSLLSAFPPKERTKFTRSVQDALAEAFPQMSSAPPKPNVTELFFEYLPTLSDIMVKQLECLINLHQLDKIIQSHQSQQSQQSQQSKPASAPGKFFSKPKSTTPPAGVLASAHTGSAPVNGVLTLGNVIDNLSDRMVKLGDLFNQFLEVIEVNPSDEISREEAQDEKNPHPQLSSGEIGKALSTFEVINGLLVKLTGLQPAAPSPGAQSASSSPASPFLGGGSGSSLG
jgi:hypothetical protein